MRWFIGAIVMVAMGSLMAGEVSNAELLAEIKAMREAYEGRISTLESTIKTLQAEKADGARRVDIKKGIDKALGEDKVATAVVERPGPKSALSGNAVRAATNVTLGGYTEFSYIDRGDRTKSFDQTRTVLEIGAQVHERITFYTEWEIEHGAIIAGGEESDGELELEQAWVDFNINDALNFRTGMILVPVGHYNLYHEGWINNFVDRPLVDRRVIGTTWFEEGAGFHGQVLDTESLGLSYEAYVFNASDAREVGASGFRGIRREGNGPVYRNQKAGAFRVAFEPARSLKRFADQFEIGVSGYISGFNGLREDDDAPKLGGDGTVQIFAIDATYEKSFKEKGTLGVRGEAAMAHVSPGREPGAPGQQSWGYYLEGYYSFWPGFLTESPFGKGFKDPRLVFAVRYDWVDADIDSFDRKDLSRTSVGISYRPTSRVVYKLDYQIDHAESRDGSGLSDSGDGSRTDAFLFGVALGF
ncbi:MAG: hypothetical protein KIS92_00240 [Planctomycetota bacterium]|nr:hypothetical protein [Planctomycetota bacterium]